ncbi:MAG: tetratricopeptide repeat protein, partial [Planctomycetota bacterium]
MLRKTTVITAALVLALCAGCQSAADSKEAIKERWQKASSQIKLAMAQQKYDNAEYKEAMDFARQSVAADPQKPEARLLLGKLYLVEGRAENATQELQMAVGLEPELSEGWYWLGVAAQGLRQLDLARSHYDKALTLSQVNVDYILAVAEILTAQDKVEEAIRLLEEKLERMPRNASLNVAAADLMSRVGRYERAVQLYRQVTLTASGDHSVKESLGYCYVFSGKWNEAAEVFSSLAQTTQTDETLEADPESRMEAEQRKRLYLQMAALCSMNCAQYDKAVDCYGKLAVEKKDDAEIWIKMGQAALGAGMTDRALMCAKEALTLRPGHPDA